MAGCFLLFVIYKKLRQYHSKFVINPFLFATKFYIIQIERKSETDKCSVHNSHKLSATPLNNEAHVNTVLHEKFSKEVKQNVCVQSWCSFDRWMYAGWDRADGETAVSDIIEQRWNSSYRDLINVAINTSVSGWLLYLNPYKQASLRQEKEKVWIY